MRSGSVRSSASSTVYIAELINSHVGPSASVRRRTLRIPPANSGKRRASGNRNQRRQQKRCGSHHSLSKPISRRSADTPGNRFRYVALPFATPATERREHLRRHQCACADRYRAGLVKASCCFPSESRGGDGGWPAHHLVSSVISAGNMVRAGLARWTIRLLGVVRNASRTLECAFEALVVLFVEEVVEVALRTMPIGFALWRR